MAQPDPSSARSPRRKRLGRRPITPPLEGNPQGYSSPSTGQSFSGYGSPQRLPLGIAFQQIFGQYQRILTRPSAATFAAEIPKAAWGIVWVQLFLWIGINVIMNLLREPNLLAVHTMVGSNPTTSIDATVASAITQGISNIYLIPMGFFLGVGFQYLFAKAFNGEGTFLAQCYTSLLFDVPTVLIISLLTLVVLFIPYVGTLFAHVVSLCILPYNSLLNVFQLMAVHRLSGRKATTIVLLPYGILFLLFLLVAITLPGFIPAFFQQMLNP